MHIAWSLPPWAWPLLAAVAVLLVAWAGRQYRRADPPPPATARRWLTGLRGAAFVLLLLALAGPAVQRFWLRTRPPEVTIVIDDSASMTFADGAAGRTRWARAVRLAAVADSVLQRRENGVSVRVWRGNGLAPARELRPGGGPADPPAAVGTDLGALLRAALAGGDGEPAQGAILLTDGHDTAGGAVPVAGGASLLAIGVGDPVGPADLLIQDLRYPGTAYQGEEARVELTVARRGGTGAGGRVVARLSQSGRVVAEAAAPAPPADGVTTLQLTLRPGASGLQVYTLEITPLDNERYLANNRATLAVDVRKERARLLALCLRPGWDARFLAQGAVAAERLRLQVVRAGPGGLVLADSDRAWTPPRDADGWRRWDGVVLVGWGGAADELPWAALAAAVRSGLGLLVLAADEPVAGRGGPPAALAELLPFESRTAMWRDGQWVTRAAPGGANHPLLAGVVGEAAPGGGLDSRQWPPLERLLSVSPRAAAQTLLEAVPLQGDNAAPGGPLLVVGRAGEGHVAWFGGRSLWRLAFWQPQGTETGDHPGRRLLINLLQWTAGADEGAGLRLAGGRQVYDEGERITLEARGDAARGAPRGGKPASIVLRALDAAGPARDRAFALAPVPGDSTRTRAVLPPLPPGRYEARLSAGDEPSAAGAARVFVVAPHAVEEWQTRQDRRALRAFAATAGGAYLDGELPDAAQRLGATLARWPLAADSRAARGRWDPLAGWPLVVLATLLLGAEWALRRVHGLI